MVEPTKEQNLKQYLGLTEQGKAPMVNDDKDDKDTPEHSLPLSGREATEFRGIVARLNFLSQNSTNFQFKVKQCSRDMANPTVGSLWRLKS